MLFYSSALATRLDASTTGFAADTTSADTTSHELVASPPHRPLSDGPQANATAANATAADATTADATAANATAADAAAAAADAAAASALAALTFADAHAADTTRADAAETLDLADYAPALPPVLAQRGPPGIDEAGAAGPATTAAREQELRPGSEVAGPAAALRPPRPPGSDAARGDAAASAEAPLPRPPSPEQGRAVQGEPSLAGALPLSMRNMLAAGEGGEGGERAAGAAGAAGSGQRGWAVQGAPSGLQPGTSEEYTVPQFTFEELECCEQLGGDKAFRLRADLKRCLTTKGTGIKVASDMLTFRAKEVGYELMYKWPQPIDETRATKSFSKLNRELTVVAPLLRQ